ncbi:hypothetical protein [Streptomyces sp. NPDC006879]|uniref:hypothetical protein n=1 Tax=Streptomyces sp. NPDC006879 TaxID=3364767 RepID=UPI003690C01D
MKNIDMTPAMAIATDEGALGTASASATPDGKNSKKKTAGRRAAKALAYFALAFTMLLVLAEPWLLIPVVALLLAVCLWD